MPNWCAIGFAVFLLADADVPRVEQFREPRSTAPSFPSATEVPLFPAPSTVAPQDGGSATSPKASRPKADKLQEETKLELIRYVSGEFARAIRALPAGKEGFDIKVGGSLDDGALDRAVATHGAAVHLGDQVQITGLQFHDKTIVVDVNGGGRGKKRWLDHIQFGMGGGMPTGSSTTTSQPQNPGPPGLQPGMGSTIFLQFSKPVPDLSPEELKHALAPILDFSKQRSAAVQWFDTLPPPIKQAIKERKAVVGMDREMVVAAIGKPGHKVRERDPEGNEIEDWIYGTPPDKTIFVRFKGERVSAIQQFPR